MQAQPDVELGRSLFSSEVILARVQRTVGASILRELEGEVVRTAQLDFSSHPPKLPPSQYRPTSLLHFYLYWLLTGSSYQELEDLTRVPHSVTKRVLQWVDRHLDDWRERHLCFRSFDDRRSARQHNVPLLLQQLRGITVLGDPTVSSVTRYCFNSSKAKRFHSYKLKRPALRFIVPSTPLLLLSSPASSESPSHAYHSIQLHPYSPLFQPHLISVDLLRL